MSNDQLQQRIQNFLTSFEPWLIKFNQYYNEDQVLRGGGAGEVTKRVSWSQHEKHVYEMTKQAALRVAAETCSEVHVIRPKQPHNYSVDGPSIMPDVIVVLKYDKTEIKIVVDAKNHAKHIPEKDCRKLIRDMGQINVYQVLVY